MENEIIICGLLPIERELLKHKGKCRACIHNDSYDNKEEWIHYCRERNERLEKEETNCKDWLLDTR